MINPSTAPRRSMTALVTSVVPCTISLTASSPTPCSATIAASPSIAPTAGSAGVVRRLCSRNDPSRASASTKSVNVPPMSNPIRIGGLLASVMLRPLLLA